MTTEHPPSYGGTCYQGPAVRDVSLFFINSKEKEERERLQCCAHQETNDLNGIIVKLIRQQLDVAVVVVVSINLKCIAPAEDAVASTLLRGTD